MARWTSEQEKELVDLFKKKRMSIQALAKKFKRNPKAIENKLRRLGLNVVAMKLEISGELDIPNDLLSLEEVLKIVAGAIQKACQGGLGKVELQRLDTIATLYKAYAGGLEQYIGYRKIEAKLAELDKKYEQLVQEAKSAKA